MSTKRPDDSEEDDGFFDDDLFDDDLFENDDDDVVVQRPMQSKPSTDSQDDDVLFDQMVESGGALSSQSSQQSNVDLFEEDLTEVIMDDEVELPNTYFTDEQGKVFNVRRTPFLIGRSKECDLVINVKGVSRQHVELTFGAGNFVVRDLDSLNGTRVNGIPAPQTRLNDADVVQIGRQKLSFFTDTMPQTRSSLSSLPRRNSSKNMPIGRPVPVRQSEEEPEFINPKRSTSELLVKANFVIVAIIILVTLGFVIWEDFFTDEPQPAQVTDPLVAGQVPSPNQNPNLLSLDGDWTQTGALPPLDTDLEQIAKAVEAEMRGEKPATQSKKTAKKKNTRDEQRLEDDVQKIQEADEQEKALKTKRAAEQTEDALEQRSVRETNEATSLLSTIRGAYISGDSLSKKLARMRTLSKSNALNGRMRRELGNTHDVYKTLVDKFNVGEKLYMQGMADDAFQVWQQLLTREKKIIGSQKSFYSRKISDRAIKTTAEKAQIADAQGDFSQALKLYQKLVQLRPDGPYKSKIEQLMASAEEKFTQAEQIMTSDPGKAVRMLQSVMDATPRDHPLHIRAESKLVWLKEGL